MSKPTKIDVLEPRERRGLVVVITGNGKGKTTSAMGMVLRACGHGHRTCVIQFMKGDLYTGEWDGIKLLGNQAELHATGKGFCGISGTRYPFKEHRADAQSAIELAREKITSGNFNMVILDELNNAVKLKLVDLEQVLELLDLRPPELHLIITGRHAHPDVIERADTASEVVELKHAYRKNVEPQPGVDF